MNFALVLLTLALWMQKGYCKVESIFRDEKDSTSYWAVIGLTIFQVIIGFLVSGATIRYAHHRSTCKQ